VLETADAEVESDVEEEPEFGKRRGPGRPRKNPLPKRRLKVMPATNGDQLVLIGVLKQSSDANLEFSGIWSLPEHNGDTFSFFSTQGGIAKPGVISLSGHWTFT
jgi:hypothetical protein